MLPTSFFVSNMLVQGGWVDIKDNQIIQDLYAEWHSINWGDTYFVLHMPPIGHYQNVTIPKNIKKLVISCHIEPIDIEWLRQLAQARPDCQICLLFDGLYAPASSYYPGNVEIYPWLSWHFQLLRMFKSFGHRPNIPKPKFWASSLCNRSTQFKLYVTAYCVDKNYIDKMLVSHHGIVDKFSDIDHLRTGHLLLDHLADIVDGLPIIKIDDTSRSDRDLPNADNRNWNFPQHTQCLFSFTNEGFHYSRKLTEHGTVIWPGPDLSEKTFKALLAGQAILPVGQWRSIAALSALGFKFDYGLDLDYDELSGDIDRILACLNVIDQIMAMPLDDLYEQTRGSSAYNAEWAVSADFGQRCNHINRQSLTQLVQWLSI